ncbi:MATH and LRR domain-containing protein PFE0570w isoform X2 [Uranotaenia lowii]|nr:MATH and LRR domain-containing protein PFE0570w isoform X2 [Uranotaenia lowii]
MDYCEPSGSRLSPPKAIIDSSPLQSSMGKNKESLKNKLLVRRSLNQLVEQGIMPSLKTSPAIYEQQRQLERAKTGDMLKAKIKQRPDRLELERRHILEHQEGNIDPSLADKKKMLQKALLVDHLNSKISHRPGPLELIEKNILHADEPIERIVKEGLVTYTATDEVLSPSDTLQSPENLNLICVEDDSLSSEGENLGENKINPISVLLFTQPPESKSSDDALQQGPSVSAISEQVTHMINLKNSYHNILQQPDIKQEISSDRLVLGNEPIKKSSSSISSNLKEKIKKKNKNKLISKARSIKFHEYKGPPNAQKHSSSSHQASGESNYQLIMKQQYLLEYLEEMCKQPPVLPVNLKSSFPAVMKERDKDLQTCDMQKKGDPASEVLNKLKVFQLKQYCKKFNLPVSGSKSSLIERLKPFLSIMEKNPEFEARNDTDILSSNELPQQKDNEEGNLLKEQQKRIAELQKQLKQSQDELELIKQNQIRSQQNFLSPTHSNYTDLSMKSETPGVSTAFKGNELTLASLHDDKLLSNMDIKITVHIDHGETELNNELPNKTLYSSKDIMSAIDTESDNLGSDTIRSHTKITEYSLGVNNYVSENETLDKLLGQVQPGIPQMKEKKDILNDNKVTLYNQKEDLLKHHKTILSNSKPDNRYNDVNLLDFHMQIDEVSTPDYNTVQYKLEESEFAENIQMKCENEKHYESDMQDSLLKNIDQDESKQVFNEFDGLKFVQNYSFGNIFDVQAKSYENPNSKIQIKNHLTNSVTFTMDSVEKHTSSNTIAESMNSHKNDWFQANAYDDATKFKTLIPNERLQSNDQGFDSIVNDNVAKLAFGSDEKNANYGVLKCFNDHSDNVNNNHHINIGQISPMDFDSLLANIDLPVCTQSCDRLMLDNNQEKLSYELQQHSLLDYLNDDYGMNDSLSCEINNTSF